MRNRTLGRRRPAIAGLALAAAWAAGVPAGAATLYVRAGAPAGGDGSQSRPFGTLAAVAGASKPGDEIIVLPVPLSQPPLDGGIALKPGQRLIGGGPPVAAGLAGGAARVSNRSTALNSGDAVVLADNVEVSNLVIVDAARGGIYGRDVTGVRILGNDLSGTNTSCTPGLYVYFPVQLPLLANGWAAIMIDEDRGTAWLSVRDNYVHDGACNDGIDIRATGVAQVAARVSANRITRLAQGRGLRSVLAIGMQTRDTAVLSVDSDFNSETYIGSPNADCEGLFTNQSGGSLTWSIDHNTFAHGIGGGSCNGAEFFTGTGIATTNLYIGHSTFAYDPGDMIEEDNGGGTSSVMNLTLEDVTVSHTSFPRALAPEPKFTNVLYMDNLGRCMDQYSWGHRNVNNLRIIDSRFSDCYGDGIGSDVTGGVYTYGGALAKSGSMDLGDGEGDAVSIDVENSRIEGTRQYALHFANHAALSDVRIRVENSRLSGARGAAVIAVDQDGSTEHADIDLGGKRAGSPGGNCIIGGATLAAEVSGYEVSAKADWWGRAGGPGTGQVSVTRGRLSASPALRAPPPACRSSP
ncbi:MAG TPA: hypothetical protein VMU52_02705 [Steroidobacteraceae bacterium]|nr:hypothetical protein [Steroidobacteraceae bacterium]